MSENPFRRGPGLAPSPSTDDPAYPSMVDYIVQIAALRGRIEKLECDLASAITCTKEAEGDRDIAWNEALAAREARRMVEESNASLRVEVATWKERAERRAAYIRCEPCPDDESCKTCQYACEEADCKRIRALADEPPRGGEQIAKDRRAAALQKLTEMPAMDMLATTLANKPAKDR